MGPAAAWLVSVADVLFKSTAYHRAASLADATDRLS